MRGRSPRIAPANSLSADASDDHVPQSVVGHARRLQVRRAEARGTDGEHAHLLLALQQRRQHHQARRHQRHPHRVL
jgi:hypothetical protein